MPTAADPETRDLPALCDSATIREHLGISRNLFDREVAAGTFPPPKWQYGNKRVWPREAVRQYLKAKELKG
jgi:predicted DNA-binding transcriptional regulator AlpA